MGFEFMMFIKDKVHTAEGMGFMTVLFFTAEFC